MRQADIFLESEGNNWLDRNRDKLGERDMVAEAIEHLGIKPWRALEIGCTNGWRLAALQNKYGCIVYGVEPSHQACVEAAVLQVPVFQTTAAALPELGKFDVVIYGFLLYLCDPADWFRIVAEGDRILTDGGHLIIQDFPDVSRPFARKYEHRDGVLSYHMRFSDLWQTHPWYQRVYGCGRGLDEYVTVLRKDTKAIPVRP